jgi:hypothetical protein
MFRFIINILNNKRKFIECVVVSFLTALILIILVCEINIGSDNKSLEKENLYTSLFEAQAGFSVLGLSIVSILVGIVDKKKYGLSVSNYVMRLNHIFPLNYDILIAETIALNVFTFYALSNGFYLLINYLFIATVLACIFLVRDATKTLYSKDKISKEIHDYILEKTKDTDIDSLYEEIKVSIISGDTLVFEDDIGLAIELLDKTFHHYNKAQLKKLEQQINTIVNTAINHSSDIVCYKTAELYISALRCANKLNRELPDNRRIFLDKLDYARCLDMMLMASAEVFMSNTAEIEQINIYDFYYEQAENYFMCGHKKSIGRSFFLKVQDSKLKEHKNYYSTLKKIINDSYYFHIIYNEYTFINYISNQVLFIKSNDIKLLEYSIDNCKLIRSDSVNNSKTYTVDFENLYVVYYIWHYLFNKSINNRFFEKNKIQIEKLLKKVKKNFDNLKLYYNNPKYKLFSSSIFEIFNHYKYYDLTIENDLDEFLIYVFGYLSDNQNFDMEGFVCLIKQNFNIYENLKGITNIFESIDYSSRYKEFLNSYVTDDGYKEEYTIEELYRNIKKGLNIAVNDLRQITIQKNRIEFHTSKIQFKMNIIEYLEETIDKYNKIKFNEFNYDDINIYEMKYNEKISLADSVSIKQLDLYFKDYYNTNEIYVLIDNAVFDLIHTEYKDFYTYLKRGLSNPENIISYIEENKPNLFYGWLTHIDISKENQNIKDRIDYYLDKPNITRILSNKNKYLAALKSDYIKISKPEVTVDLRENEDQENIDIIINLKFKYELPDRNIGVIFYSEQKPNETAN